MFKNCKIATRDNWTVAVCDGSRGVTDEEITISSFPAESLFMIPRVGESLTMKEGYFMICEVSHNMKTKTITLWIDAEQSDYN